MIRIFLFSILWVTFSYEASACNGQPGSVEKLVCLADSLKATMTSSQIATMQLSYLYTNAQTWSNLPTTMQARLGIKLGSLSSAQLGIAKLIMKECSGSTKNEGMDELEQLLLADDYLGANGGGASTYSAGNYYLCFNGTPSLTGLFEIKFGGHHLAIANTYNNGVMVGATPHFEALEPLSFVTSGTTYAPMTQEKAAFVAMLAGLEASNLAKAKLSSTFGDLLLGAKNNGTAKDWQFPTTKSGLKVGDLNATQKALVMQAIKTYVLDADDQNSTLILNQYQSELDNTYIAYSGNTSMETRNDYVRIDGPGVWIEFSVQGGIVFSGVHYHSIWRDHLRDYGGTGSTNGVYNTSVGLQNSTATIDLSTNSTIEVQQPFPNPFTQSATLNYSIKQASHVDIQLINGQGMNVFNLENDNKAAGNYSIPISDEQNNWPQGQYFIVITITDHQKVEKVIRRIVKI